MYRKDVSVAVDPGLDRGQLTEFWYFWLLLKLHYFRVVVVRFVEPFGDNF